MSSSTRRACILVSCADQPGIVSAVSTFLHQRGANIVQLDQYSSNDTEGAYFCRVEFDHPRETSDRASIERGFTAIAEAFDMTWRLAYSDERKRMAILASHADHCLLELLWRCRWGELPVEISMVISNHDTLRPIVEGFNIPFHHLSVTKETKPAQEAAVLKLLNEDSDFAVLARYMQILSPSFLAGFPRHIINIHHSFLPAFVGGKPYEQAYARGVKIIGATAHYVTAELDAGPIIEQDVARVDHRSSAQDLKAIGRNIERTVLARAVKWHVEDRVLVHGNKTVVFA